MKRTPSHEDALLAHGEAIAAILEEKQDKLAIRKEVEALVRDSFRAVAFAIDRYLVVLAAVPESRMAISSLAEAKESCHRRIMRLRRRVARSVARLCGHMSDHDLMSTAEYVLSISS
jgi:hypothetical protein